MKIKKQELNHPGSGFAWKKKITVPKEFNFSTENHQNLQYNNSKVNQLEQQPGKSSSKVNNK